MTRYHPWRTARNKHADTVIDCTRELPEGVAGYTDGTDICICRTLTQAARRSVLTHELIHLERGLPSTDPRYEAREEKLVDELAARLLIPLDSLVNALVWTRGQPDDECAWELWTDLHTLLVRVRTLPPHERAYINSELDRRSN